MSVRKSQAAVIFRSTLQSSIAKAFVQQTVQVQLSSLLHKHNKYRKYVPVEVWPDDNE